MKFVPTDDTNVICCYNDHSSLVGRIIKQEPCNGFMFEASRPICLPDLQEILCEMHCIGKSNCVVNCCAHSV